MSVSTSRTSPSPSRTSDKQSRVYAPSTSVRFPPTPPGTDVDSDDGTSASTRLDVPLPPPSTTQRILDVDKPTPDAHVPRDPRLIRLTGTHPFNAEAPLGDLFNEGFLTTPELFYVRNHGAVPEVQDAECLDWEISIEGLVANPLRITLRHLLEEYENVTHPITLVCAGNRRKEQNIVRKSKGFSWGAAGVSTALFTGVVMRDVIERAKPLRQAKYVCMEGADKLPNGYYGTSVKLNWVMDANRGIMLAHKMNGETLTPDHGKPLRAVVPGQIGGRSVKWLKRIIITSEPSDNWYHIYDNRVLPTMVSPEESAQNPKWWTDERYAIYDLSPNSAIAFPAHGEQLSLAATPSYKIRGYAYSGGGRRITRCEVSLDKGKTWRLAKIEYAEDRYRAYADRDLYGGRLDMDWRETSFCWCFWSLDIDTANLAAASDVLVRAMDESMCIQPRDIYWSVLGMMNNPWYRIAIHHEPNSLLRFEHPTQPALMPGGWMERVKKEGGDLTNGFWGEKTGSEDSVAAADKVEDIKMTKDGVDTIIELDELRAHDNDENPWFVVNGHVYDGTAFLSAHPGGAQSIVSAAASDATDEFMAIHSETAKAMMPAHHIGRLSPSALARLTATEPTSLSTTTSISPDTPFLSPRTWRTAHLITKTPVSSDTHIYTFTLPHPTQSLGLPTGQHLLLRLPSPSSNTPLIRPYTPISPTSDSGTFSLLIKTYPRPTSLPTSLAALPLGAPVSFKGPLGSFTYARHGTFHLNGVQRHAHRFVMLCAGTGIAPVLGVLRTVLQDESDPTTCVVLDCNRSEADILCRAELEMLVARSQGRGRVEHVLSCAGQTWEGRTGRVCGEVVEEVCGVQRPGGNEGTVVLVCGPPGWEECVRGLLKERGWAGDDVVFF